MESKGSMMDTNSSKNPDDDKFFSLLIGADVSLNEDSNEHRPVVDVDKVTESKMDKSRGTRETTTSIDTYDTVVDSISSDATIERSNSEGADRGYDTRDHTVNTLEDTNHTSDHRKNYPQINDIDNDISTNNQVLHKRHGTKVPSTTDDTPVNTSALTESTTRRQRITRIESNRRTTSNKSIKSSSTSTSTSTDDRTVHAKKRNRTRRNKHTHQSEEPRDTASSRCDNNGDGDYNILAESVDHDENYASDDTNNCVDLDDQGYVSVNLDDIFPSLVISNDIKRKCKASYAKCKASHPDESIFTTYSYKNISDGIICNETEVYGVVDMEFNYKQTFCNMFWRSPTVKDLLETTTHISTFVDTRVPKEWLLCPELIGYFLRMQPSPEDLFRLYITVEDLLSIDEYEELDHFSFAHAPFIKWSDYCGMTLGHANTLNYNFSRLLAGGLKPQYLSDVTTDAAELTTLAPTLPSHMNRKDKKKWLSLFDKYGVEIAVPSDTNRKGRSKTHKHSSRRSDSTQSVEHVEGRRLHHPPSYGRNMDVNIYSKNNNLHHSYESVRHTRTTGRGHIDRSIGPNDRSRRPERRNKRYPHRYNESSNPH